ncbi:hypothetical protein BJY00DRAFT_270526 [Aspergillus carlsbadensis]|nr:hypothetical protein BJY00DRAFT_270526 [Aspergillus carlsbadensis]
MERYGETLGANHWQPSVCCGWVSDHLAANHFPFLLVVGICQRMPCLPRSYLQKQRVRDCMIRVSVLSPGFKPEQTLDGSIWIPNRDKLKSVYPCFRQSVSSIITHHIQSAVDPPSPLSRRGCTGVSWAMVSCINAHCAVQKRLAIPPKRPQGGEDEQPVGSLKRLSRERF